RAGVTGAWTAIPAGARRYAAGGAAMGLGAERGIFRGCDATRQSHCARAGQSEGSHVRGDPIWRRVADLSRNEEAERVERYPSTISRRGVIAAAAASCL